MTSFVIPNDSIESWLQTLKPYQRATIDHFMLTMSAEAAAEKWLTTIGSPNIAGFGGGTTQDTKPYWDKFKAECRRFICDDSAYADEKKEILSASGVSKPVLVSTMSGLIGATLGTPGTLIAPAITLVLFTIGSIGRKAYCAT